MTAPDTPGGSLAGGYLPADGVYDEMVSATGRRRKHWQPFSDALSGLGQPELVRRWKTARQRIRDNGVTYNVYGDPQGIERPWSLDAIPLLIPPDEWRQLEEGLVQRARLLNMILADLYGPQRLLKDGLLPPAVVFGNPGFWRPCHNVPVRNGKYLQLIGVDLARSPEGEWWVLADRTQTPSGAGYALENRIVIAETFPDLFREFEVQRLASFFRSFRDNLTDLAPTRSRNPRIVLLTPGPLNETYFEHSYLARYLGFTLAQGADLTVRDDRVFLKTLEGLKPVDVLLRRVDDDFCDPIELRPDSMLGVAGLLQAVRAGNVAVANAIGSGVLETPAIMPFLPGLSRSLLGEPLKLKSVATWWCGQEGPRDYVRDHLDQLVIKPSFRSFRGGKQEPVFGGKLSTEERRRLVARIDANPWNFAGQELLHLSTAPVWSGDGISPRRISLRVYLAAVGDTWVAMPGGLCRVSPTIDTPVVSMQQGGGSKDAWVLSDGPVDKFTLRQPPDSPVRITRGEHSDLPSRAADFLFWLGRYAERSEHIARSLRVILTRLTSESASPGSPEWESMLRLYETVAPDNPRLQEDHPQGRLDFVRDLEQEILSLIFEEQRYESLNANLIRAARMVAQVRDRVSGDLIRITGQFSTLARPEPGTPWGYIPAGDAMSVLNRAISTLASLRGTEMENMTRGPGWRFLNLGRRLERAILMVRLFRSVMGALNAAMIPKLEMLLDVCDSSMTYRSRYFTVLQPAPVLDLLMNDELNPRSLAFLLKDLSEHCGVLATFLSRGGTEWPRAAQRRVEDAGAALFGTDVRHLCESRLLLDSRLSALDAALPAFSVAITNSCFSHAEVERAA